MPIYEYECMQCGKIEEALQSFSEKPLTTCKHCAGKLRKLVSHSSFHLKGSGWYVTDYAKKGTDGSPKDSGSTPKDSGSTPKDSGSAPKDTGSAPKDTGNTQSSEKKSDKTIPDKKNSTGKND